MFGCQTKVYHRTMQTQLQPHFGIRDNFMHFDKIVSLVQLTSLRRKLTDQKKPNLKMTKSLVQISLIIFWLSGKWTSHARHQINLIQIKPHAQLVVSSCFLLVCGSWDLTLIAILRNLHLFEKHFYSGLHKKSVFPKSWNWSFWFGDF